MVVTRLLDQGFQITGYIGVMIRETDLMPGSDPRRFQGMEKPLRFPDGAECQAGPQILCRKIVTGQSAKTAYFSRGLIHRKTRVHLFKIGLHLIKPLCRTTFTSCQ